MLRMLIQNICSIALVTTLVPFLVSAQPKIKIGATLPLTGNLSSYGENIRRGIEFAIEDSSQEESKIIFSPEDTPMSGAGVLSVFNKLRSANKIQAIAGNFSNVAMLALAPELGRNKIIAMHTAALDDDILAASHGWIFSTNTRISDEAREIAQYAYNQKGARAASVITIQTNFGLSYQKYFVEEFTRLGGTIVSSEFYQLGETDYKAQLTRIKSTNPDFLFAATFGHFLGLTLKQGREMGIKCPVFSVYESEDDSVIEAGL